MSRKPYAATSIIEVQHQLARASARTPSPSARTPSARDLLTVTAISLPLPVYKRPASRNALLSATATRYCFVVAP